MKSQYFILLFVVFWILIVLWRLIIVLDKSPSDTCPIGKVCLNQNEYQHLLTEQHKIQPTRIPLASPSYTRERDLRVLNDPLYPALNRTEKNAFEGVIDNTLKRNFNIPTNTYNDTYHLVGYVVNEEDKTSSKWKLFGRQKDRNKGEYFMVPVDRTIDMKIQITDDIVEGEKLRSVDTIPNEIKFKTPLLSNTPYKFTELPKADLADEYF